MITAVIPVRKGSQRVKDKNLRKFADTTLLELKIRTLLQVPEIDSVIVNTNSDEAISIVENRIREGETRLGYQRRDEYFASSQCSGSEFFEHLGRVTDTDVFIYAPCTSPFVSEQTIRKCITLYLQNDTDCVSTVSAVKEFLWLNGEPLNYDPRNAPNSQDLPDVYALNFGITIVDRDKLIKNRNIIGDKPLFYKTNDIESIDIDTPLDFFLAEQVYIKMGGIVSDISEIVL